MTRATLLISAGVILFGPYFKSELANTLDADLRELRKWCAGSKPIPEWVIGEVRKLLTERRAALNNLILAFEPESADV